MRRLSYAGRPAKFIQRRMVIDTFRRLRVFSPLRDYQYVGMGGLEYVDFELVHRELGLTNMVSVERDTNSANRYEFNAPFADIELRFQSVRDVLPDLLDEPILRIMWLDYTDGLTTEVLQDLRIAMRKLLAGSAFVMTVNAQAPMRSDERLRDFENLVGAERVPAGTTDATLAKWGWANACYRVIFAEAEAEAARRSDGVRLEQLLHFQYADDARMLTWGGTLLGAANRPAFHSAGFNDLPHVRLSGNAPMIIDPPVLTMREAIHLNAQLPIIDPAGLNAPGIPTPELVNYSDLYRWYPPVPTPM